MPALHCLLWIYDLAGEHATCVSALLLQVSSQCVIRIGIDSSPWGDLATRNLYNYTFERYLNEQLSYTTSCTFKLVLFQGIDTFVAAGVARSIDIFFSGPGVFVCLQVTFCLTAFLALVPVVEALLSWCISCMYHQTML